jgi:GT2 family glycosyltransferase
MNSENLREVGRSEVRPKTLATLLTCHNRKAMTLDCLAALHACRLPEGTNLNVILVDDASTDGTSEAVADRFPRTIVLHGDGTLFWNRGMHTAFQWALSRGYDYYLWLNDDTILSTDAIERLLATATATRGRSQPGIIVGSTCDPQLGVRTYGGLVRRQRWRPLKFEPLAPGTAPMMCDAMNGNCVLVPAEVAAVVGNLDWTFEHSMGDFDYALRARRKGFPIWIAPGFFGTCKRHPSGGDFLDRSLPIGDRLRSAVNRKNLPPRAWAVYVRRHAGPFWPAYWAWPYLKVFFSSIFALNRDPRVL